MPSRSPFLLFLALSLVAVAAHAWWNEEWPNRKVITLDTGPGGVAITTPVADLPVPVRLHTGNFPHFLSSLENGADLRFLAEDDTTPLKFHVERWDAINEMALVWVKVPKLAPGTATKFHMYFNNPAAVAAQEPALALDADMGLVYRFTEPAGPPQDTSANANHATASTAVPVPASLIAGGVRFDGGQAITIADNPTLAQAAETGFTFSAWVKTGGAVAAPTTPAPAADPAAAPAAPAAEPAAAAPAAAAPAGDGVLFDRVSTAGARVALVLEGGALKAIVQPAGGAAVESPPSAPLAGGAWHHLALVVGPTRTAVHVDGVEVTGIDTPAFAHSGDIHVGASSRGDAFFTGELDELQLARVARSADYLKLAAAAQGEGSGFVVIGADETPDTAGGGEGAGHASPFVVIIKAVFANEEALVEQLVIGFCGLMLFVSMAIMVGKAMFLSAATAATAKFLKSFEKLGATEPLDALYDRRKRYGKSPLFRVYRIGIDEVRKRLHPSVGAAGSGIDSKGFTTIKAALDASMVREGQRLNAQMSLLTIAISGGPFIGLLGTVVGVMITFGAIAATGDVNIAAIAPGMAAALLATVAGLGVAIPSLFGYNYLGGIIKNINADMHVFTDEFLARINEAHGE
jgi:biopolymer transport protein ExbB